MKGFILQYPFAIIIFVVAVILIVSILSGITSRSKTPEINIPVDVGYACQQYNSTEVSYENFEVVLYGFLTGQCNYFQATLKDTITANKIKKSSEKVDKSINVITIDSCNLPNFNSHSIYLCCKDTIEKNKVINIVRREIKNSDVLICES